MLPRVSRFFTQSQFGVGIISDSSDNPRDAGLGDNGYFICFALICFFIHTPDILKSQDMANL